MKVILMKNRKVYQYLIIEFEIFEKFSDVRFLNIFKFCVEKIFVIFIKIIFI